jgi:hypothetical protein
MYIYIYIYIIILTAAGMLHIKFLECYRMSHRPWTSFFKHGTGSLGFSKINLISYCAERLARQEGFLCNYANGLQNKESLFKNLIPFAYKPFVGELIKKDEM